MAPDQAEGVAVVQADPAGQGIGQGVLLRQLDRPASAQAVDHDRGAVHRNADHPDGRVGRLQGDGDARDEAAARQGDDDGVHLGQVLDQLQADRALPGDDRRVVERIDPDQPSLGLEVERAGFGLVIARAVHHQLGAQAPDRLHLAGRHALRNADHSPDAELLRDIGYRPAVVAAGHGDHAPRPLLGGQAQQLVGRPPDLERSGLLQALQLEMDGGAGALRQPGGVEQGSPADQAGDPLPGQFYVVQGWVGCYH